MSPSPDPRTTRVVQFFETLSPASVSMLEAIYTEQARFKDPFNEVTSVAGIQRVFMHMFETINTPRFIVRSAMTQGDEAWLTWDFLIKRPQGELIIHGASHLRYAPDGRIQQHRDYWDPAEELYAHIPVLGTLVRWLTRRLSATA
ncbi:nuclear transport factor 2 family protein [Aquabacterium sp.]|uniref:nuclear transport factor 2 family protein n=1 Tax=Aquabacterium sp. TaxID=1872578 RepID=UPI0025C1D5A9|nr:nuclear transport factor 2 family protein [Aquabacterium sp.]